MSGRAFEIRTHQRVRFNNGAESNPLSRNTRALAFVEDGPSWGEEGILSLFGPLFILKMEILWFFSNEINAQWGAFILGCRGYPWRGICHYQGGALFLGRGFTTWCDVLAPQVLRPLQICLFLKCTKIFLFKVFYSPPQKFSKKPTKASLLGHAPQQCIFLTFIFLSESCVSHPSHPIAPYWPYCYNSCTLSRSLTCCYRIRSWKIPHLDPILTKIYRWPKMFVPVIVIQLIN